MEQDLVVSPLAVFEWAIKFTESVPGLIQLLFFLIPN
jgi:hypothetical protein